MSAPTPAHPLPAGLVVLGASFVVALLDGGTAARRHAAVLARGVVSWATLGEVFSELAASTGA